MVEVGQDAGFDFKLSMGSRRCVETLLDGTEPLHDQVTSDEHCAEATCVEQAFDTVGARLQSRTWR